jgi:hypothetical protein
MFLRRAAPTVRICARRLTAPAGDAGPTPTASDAAAKATNVIGNNLLPIGVGVLSAVVVYNALCYQGSSEERVVPGERTRRY